MAYSTKPSTRKLFSNTVLRHFADIIIQTFSSREFAEEFSLEEADSEFDCEDYV
jgi:hypothetical protein